MRSSEIKMTIFDECVSVYLCVHACVRVYASVKHKSRFIVWHRENLLCYCIICVCEYFGTCEKRMTVLPLNENLCLLDGGTFHDFTFLSFYCIVKRRFLRCYSTRTHMPANEHE